MDSYFPTHPVMCHHLSQINHEIDGWAGPQALAMKLTAYEMNLKIPFIKTNTLSVWDENVHITFRFPCSNIPVFPLWKTHSIDLI